jgi:hypothetical protein
MYYVNNYYHFIPKYNLYYCRLNQDFYVYFNVIHCLAYLSIDHNIFYCLLFEYNLIHLVNRQIDCSFKKMLNFYCLFFKYYFILSAYYKDHVFINTLVHFEYNYKLIILIFCFMNLIHELENAMILITFNCLNQVDCFQFYFFIFIVFISNFLIFNFTFVIILIINYYLALLLLIYSLILNHHILMELN